MHRRLPIFATTAVLVITGTIAMFSCQGTGIDTAVEMKASLDKDVPAGTAVATATSRLKAHGFIVTAETDAPWGGRTHADYLYGDLHEGQVVQRRWQVAVSNKAGVVTGIDVTTGLVGP